jgi:hypothetical protein
MQAVQTIHTLHEQDILEMFRRHVAAFYSGNLEAVIDDFTEQSIVITPEGVFEGLDRIRGLYRALLAEFGVIDRGDSPGLTVDTRHVRHDTLFIAWHAVSKNHLYPFGTDTFVCHDGKVVRQTISYPPPLAR